nr:hypothetical protein [Streptomyces sp. alain-838]
MRTPTSRATSRPTGRSASMSVSTSRVSTGWLRVSRVTTSESTATIPSVGQ